MVHLFSNQRVDPGRLSAVGYGEYKPIASNDTVEGRSKNRRISIVVLSDAIARSSNRDQQLADTEASKAKEKAQQDEPVKIQGIIQPINILPPVRQ